MTKIKKLNGWIGFEDNSLVIKRTGTSLLIDTLGIGTNRERIIVEEYKLRKLLEELDNK